MKNAMIKITTKATAAMLVAATVFTTVAPPVYAAEDTAVVAEVQGAVEADWLDDLVEEQREQNKKAVEEFDNSGWGRILDYIWDSIFG